MRSPSGNYILFSSGHPNDHRLQGIQSTFDVPSFGSFAISHLQAIKDDYGKTALLALPILSTASYAPELDQVDDVAACRKIINDALVIAEMEGEDDPLASLVIPIQSPFAWKKDNWLDGVALDVCPSNAV